MKIQSSVFENNQNIPKKFTCDGADISPPLKIFGVPKNAQSLALIVDDPDAPGGTFVHWTMWNIPVEILEIQEGVTPAESIEGITSFGTTGYGGPCPPSGIHRYFFKIYALEDKLNLSDDADKSQLFEAMKGRILDEAELVGLYKRNK
ncbi:MAG: phosphatidylethanolamine-binding protein [Candidatus Doudnabacteria bacterium RIFCSPHIGHO2_01_FULL_43_23]|uniref:Phosphatidylethanolamine-binding protein n=1 Tax=Candidatus Doudnabacteria bacterium RIFCSPHIGHO2_01_FULL_43_23 TaxID=1817822 RepID=A0A1F5NVG0_9BACT|nr:MAG: phosphatidylethanolamine-binding protein [Candidatus Doudnabacteria bacterium RIFCSPHIGHO2_01_FULL_43_23]